MQLLMAMQERVAGIVGDEVDGDLLKRHHVDRVLDEAAHVLIADARDLEAVTMEMHGMLITSSIAKEQAIAPSCLDHQRLHIRPRVTVDSPGVEPGAVQCAGVADGEREGVLWFGHGGLCREDSVIPGIILRIVPRGWSGPSSIFDDNSEAHL